MWMTLLEFQCHGYRFGLPVASVRRVIQSAQPSPLPDMPDSVIGVLNIGGELVTVVNFHRLVGLPFDAINLSQQLLLVDIPGFCIGVLVDSVSGVTSREIEGESCIPRRLTATDTIQTVIRLDDGVCVICHPERFLLSEEKVLLAEALEHFRHAEH